MQVLTEQQARQRVLELVWHAKAALGLQSPPRYMGVKDSIAIHLGIVVREEALPFDEGQYIPADPPIVVLNPQIGDPDRLNFTFFHEISHHLIRQDDVLYSFLHEYAPNDEDFKIALNRYCNIAAAEFLIPSEDVRKVIAERGFSITLVGYLEPQYPASKPAIAIQLAQCASHKCFVVICEYGWVPQRATQQIRMDGVSQVRQPQLYVLYASSSPSVAKYTIARFVPIPKDHIITASYESRQLVRGLARIPFRSGTLWECECEAFFHKGKIYAAFNDSLPMSPHQLPLF